MAKRKKRRSNTAYPAPRADAAVPGLARPLDAPDNPDATVDGRGKPWLWIAVVVLLAVSTLLPLFISRRSDDGGRGPDMGRRPPRAGEWRLPPPGHVGEWTLRHADGSLWYHGRYRDASAEGAEAGMTAATAGTRPVGQHYVFRAGALRDLPEDQAKPEFRRAIVEELDFDDIAAPALDRAWEPSTPPRVPGGLTGHWFLYNGNGERTFAGRFVNGVADGLLAQWLDDGSLVENTFVAGKKQGPARAFHPDGKIRYTCQYDNDLLEGPFTHFAAAGGRERLEHFRAGRLQGVATQYGPNGKPTIEETYLAGVRDGLTNIYDAEGRLRQQLTHQAGEQTGPFTEFHPNGRPALRGEMRNGVLNGWLERFDEEGRRVSRVRLENGAEVDPDKPGWVTPEADSRRLPDTPFSSATPGEVNSPDPPPAPAPAAPAAGGGEETSPE